MSGGFKAKKEEEKKERDKKKKSPFVDPSADQ
jgi:hypothetical protein